MKWIFLGTTALCGMALVALPAMAGPVAANDAFDLSIGLELRYRFDHTSQTQTLGRGRGYALAADEGEFKVRGNRKGDNGLLYGFEIETNALTSDATMSDEAWMFVEDGWGRVEMGDQDSANDRLFRAAENVMAGRQGWEGDIIDIWTGADILNVNGRTSDATKVTYFTPRLLGFQLGASFTPDSGQNGFTRDADDDGDFEKIFGLAGAYEAQFSEVTLKLTGFVERGDSEVAAPAGGASEHDLDMYGVGGTVEYAGFGLGAGRVDLDKSGVVTTVAGDAGAWWNLAASYGEGPWKLSAGYYESRHRLGATVTHRVDIVAFDGHYNVAPGWQAAAGLYFMDVTDLNVAGDDNDGHIVLLSNQFLF